MQHFLLPSGKQLLYEQTNKFKGEYFAAHYQRPVKRENMTVSTLLSSILLRGSEKYPTQQLLSRRCEELYALSLNTASQRTGAVHSLSFEMSMLSNAYSIDGTDITAEAIALLGNITGKPLIKHGAFDAAYTEREKKNLHDALAAQINSKTYYARKRTLELMCENETAGILAQGYIDEIDAITPEKAADYLKDTLSSSELMITYIGACDADRLCEYIENSLPASKNSMQKTRPERREAKEFRNFSQQMDVSQTKVVIGFRSPRDLFDADYVKYALFNELFGGGVSSRLFMNVREKKGLCYYCNSRSYALDGITLVEAGVKKGDADVLTEAVFEQIRDLQSGNVSDAELDCAKRSLSHGYTSAGDSPSSLASWYFVRSAADRYDSPLDAVNSLKTVTKDDVAEMAHTLVPDCRFVLEG